MFFDPFWLSKTEYKSLLGEVTFVKVISLHKALFLFYAIIDNQFKTSELESIEKLVDNKFKP